MEALDQCEIARAKSWQTTFPPKCVLARHFSDFPRLIEPYRFFGPFVRPIFFFEKFLSNVTGCFGSYSPMTPPPGRNIVVQAPHRSSEILPTCTPFFCRAATCPFKSSQVKNISCLLFWSCG